MSFLPRKRLGFGRSSLRKRQGAQHKGAKTHVSKIALERRRRNGFAGAFGLEFHRPGS